MAYDLYGNYYASHLDAMNAEMAQCAAIDASIAARDLRELQEREQAASYYLEEWQRHIEERVALLEKFVPISLCEGEGR